MELEKRIVRMEKRKYCTDTQIALEEDRNLQDNKPDIGAILRKKGYIVLEESRAFDQHALLKGKLVYQVLYQSDENREICGIDGQIEFEEQIHVEGLKAEELLQCSFNLDDLSIETINTRKLSVQAIVAFTLCVDDMEDLEIPLDVQEPNEIQCKREKLEIASLAIMKKDIYRVKEEIELPQNEPNVGKLLWQEANLTELEFRTATDKIFIKGELRTFFLYEAQDKDGSLHFFNSTIPLNGVLECQGCKEAMTCDIKTQMNSLELSVQEDFDGEMRIFSLDMALGLSIRLFEEQQMEMLSDCYGIYKKATIEKKTAYYQSQMIHAAGRCKVAEKVKVPENAIGMRTVLSTAWIQKEEENLSEKGIELLGSVEADFLLYQEENGDFYPLQTSIPFKYLLETPGMEKGGICHLDIWADNLALSINGEDTEAKAAITFDVSAYQVEQREMIADIIWEEQMEDKEKKRPSIVGYVIGDGESLWDIGKKFMVSTDKLKEDNKLTTEEVNRGDILMIIR